MTTTVGVVMTVYNLGDFVAEAIESVLQQNVRPDDIIIVNDGSSDNSLEIIARYSDRVRIIDNKINLGVLPSVLLALSQLNTDIVAMIDGDDRWANDKIRRVKDLFASDPNAMLCTHSYRRIDRHGNVIPGKDHTLANLDRITGLTGDDVGKMDLLLKESVLAYHGVWLGSALSFRRSCFDADAFTKFSEGLSGHDLSHQDQPIAAFMIMRNPTMRIRFIDLVLFDYRIFGDNSSGSSGTIDKALRTLARSRATLLRTKAVVEQMPEREAELSRQKYKLLEVDYLRSLYTKHYRTAGSDFLRLFIRFWNWRECLKEIVRFAGVVIFGPDRFLKHK